MGLYKFIKHRDEYLPRYIQFLSGITLMMYAGLVVIAAAPVNSCVAIFDLPFNSIAPFPVWITALAITGLVQAIAAIFNNPIAHILASYPAGVAFLFAGVGGMIFRPGIDPALGLAFMWAVLNWTVIHGMKERILHK